MNRRKVLSVKGEVKVIWQVEDGKKKADVCWEFCPVNSTIQMIWKKQNQNLSTGEQNGLKIKRFLKPERSDIYEALT